MSELVIYKSLDKIMEDNLYPSPQVLYKIVKETNPKITMNQIKKYIESKSAYQQTKEKHVKKTSMGYVVSFEKMKNLQIDLLDLSKYHKTNKGYKYVLIMIDIFSRFVDAIMIKTKNIEDTTNALKLMLDFNNIEPNIIISDSESSFLSKPFQAFLKERNIYHDAVVLNNHRALSVIDRFCRTLRSRLTKLMLNRDSTEWTEFLSKIIYQYNNTPNRGILKFTPQEVLNDEKIQDIILELNHQKSSKNQLLKSKDKFRVGDHVRIYNNDKFKKGSSYSSEVYQIKSIVGKNITLTNGKREVSHNLLKVYVGDSLLENGDDPDDHKKVLNVIEDAHKENKISKKLKQVGIDQGNEREKREKKKVDYVKLSKGL